MKETVDVKGLSCAINTHNQIGLVGTFSVKKNVYHGFFLLKTRNLRQAIQNAKSKICGNDNFCIYKIDDKLFLEKLLSECSSPCLLEFRSLKPEFWEGEIETIKDFVEKSTSLGDLI